MSPKEIVDMYNAKAYHDIADVGIERAIRSCPDATVGAQGVYPCPVLDCTESFPNCDALIAHVAIMMFAESQSGYQVAGVHRGMLEGARVNIEGDVHKCATCHEDVNTDNLTGIISTLCAL